MVHIVNNHSVATIPINLPEVNATYVNLTDKKPLPLMILEGIKALYIRLFGEKRIDPQLMGLHDIEADAYAVRHTRILLAAVSCFYRLSGGDMQGASHNLIYPAISWSERI